MKKLGLLVAQCSLVSQENSVMVLLFQILPAWSYAWDLPKMSRAALQADYIDFHVSQRIEVLSPCNHLSSSGPVKGVDTAVIATCFGLGLPSCRLLKAANSYTCQSLLQPNETGKQTAKRYVSSQK